LKNILIAGKSVSQDVRESESQVGLLVSCMVCEQTTVWGFWLKDSPPDAKIIVVNTDG